MRIVILYQCTACENEIKVELKKMPQVPSLEEIEHKYSQPCRVCRARKALMHPAVVQGIT